MIRLSPKALRFAEHAALSLADAAVPSTDDLGAWRRWRATDRGPSGANAHVEVPDAVARVLLTAVGRMIDDMRGRSAREGDPDGDLGNDIAFLAGVRGALSDGLGRRGDRAG